MTKDEQGINEIFNVLAKDMPDTDKVNISKMIVANVLKHRDEDKPDYSKQGRLEFK